MTRWLCLSWVVLALWPMLAIAQETAPAVLIADRVSITPDGQLIAEGNVEAFRGQQKITARRITYDRSTETLQIDGPVRLSDGDEILILADGAALDRALQDGLITGARMVLAEQVQLSAVELKRSQGRYSQLYKTSVTSCRVCAEGEAPLWQIRARRVIHDQEEKQLYFEDAQLRVMDVPVFYLPRLRLPDPTLDRASGFLVPALRTTSQLGTGVRVPYFFRINERSDLTLEPYLSSSTRTLGVQYRYAFARGRLALEGAFTDDDLLTSSRGYAFGAAAFALGNDFELTFDLEWASDNAYLVDYGLPDLDRLSSEVALTRTMRDSYLRAGIIKFQSLRDGENESLLPTIVLDAAYERRFFPDAVGGELRFGVWGHAHDRTSDLDVLGRDVTRMTADVSWLRDWIFGNGVRADWHMGFSADVFDIRQDSTFPDQLTQVTPRAALALSLPMTQSIGATTHFLEPVVQLGWSNVSGDAVPNEESGFVEFDQGNLLSLSRFPAPDVREDGPQLAYGINYARFGPTWQGRLTLGQIFRRDAQPDFTATSGLAGELSDILVAGQLKTQFGVDLTARTVFDGSFDVAKAEVRGDWRGEVLSLTGSYLWLQSDAAENRVRDVSEVYFDGAYKLSTFWTASANWRYDVSGNRATAAGLGLTYRNECVEIDLSVNRRYTSSTSVEPTTDFGFTIALRGFNASNGAERYVRSCNS